MSFDSIAFLFRRAFSNIYKNLLLTTASVTVLTICLVIFGSSYLLIQNVNIMITDISARSQIVVYLREDITDEEVTELKANLESIDNINSVEFESKEQALQNYIESLSSDYPDIEEGLDAEIFRSSFIIDIVNLNKFDQTIYEIETNYADDIGNISQKRDVIDKITRIRDVISFLSIWVMLFLAVISLFMISNSVKTAVYARRDEIMIMKYVGSTDFFIQFPYFIEGLIIGAVSGLLAYVLTRSVYNQMIMPILTDLGFFTPAVFNDSFTYIIWIFLAVGMVIGSFGSVWSINKYLKV